MRIRGRAGHSGGKRCNPAYAVAGRRHRPVHRLQPGVPRHQPAGTERQQRPADSGKRPAVHPAPPCAGRAGLCPGHHWLFRAHPLHRGAVGNPGGAERSPAGGHRGRFSGGGGRPPRPAVPGVGCAGKPAGHQRGLSFRLAGRHRAGAATPGPCQNGRPGGALRFVQFCSSSAGRPASSRRFTPPQFSRNTWKPISAKG